MRRFSAYPLVSLYLRSRGAAFFCVSLGFPLPQVEGCSVFLRFPCFPSTSGREAQRLERMARAELPAGRAEKHPKFFRRDQPPRCVLRGGGAVPPPPFPQAPQSLHLRLSFPRLSHPSFLTICSSSSSLPPRPISSPVFLALLLAFLLTLPSPLYLRYSSDL